jgi:hypothetical protein
MAMGLLWDNSLSAFLVLTVILGGGAAWMTGRAFAREWRPLWKLILAMLLLGLAVRFFHWGLAQGTLLSLYYYAVDSGVLIAIASLSYRLARTSQMATQYPWLYRRTSPITWAKR